MKTVVAKFGGTSVATGERILALCRIVQKENSRHPVVVVSALSKVTDMLLSLFVAPVKERRQILSEIKQKHQAVIEDIFSDKKSKEICSVYVESCLEKIAVLTKKRKASLQLKDQVISYGEILSSFLVAHALSAQGVSAEQVIATELIVTDNHFGSAEFIVDATKEKVEKRLRPLLEKNSIPVITGFIGATKNGRITTLGRGGSDYTASIIGYCLLVEEIQIWTDVDGVYTADPRLVKNVKLLHAISYKEASEMAFFGAKVLHPRTIRPAIKARIPVRVLNSFKPDGKGTYIVEKPQVRNHIAAISSKRKITIVNMYSTDMLFSKGFLARIFDIFAKYNISIDLVGVSEVSVSVTLENVDNLDKAMEELAEFTNISKTNSLGIVSVIGEGIASSTDTVGEIFETVRKKNATVKMVSLGATDINISFVVSEQHIDEIVKALHKKLNVGARTHSK